MRVLSDFTHKVFKVDQVAVATYGFAFINNRNIAGHVAEFVRELDEPLRPEALAQRLSGRFGALLEEHFEAGLDLRPDAGSDVLGFLVAGYADGTGVLFEVGLPSGTITRIADSNVGGAAWRGQTDVVIRLIKGFDLTLFSELTSSIDKAQLDAVQPAMNGMEYAIPFNSLNLQDAIDFAALLIRTTIDVQRLTYGSAAKLGSWPGVGGPIEIAAVTPTSGFEWVQRTTLLGERPAGTAEQG
jgi:hypothetical protein